MKKDYWKWHARKEIIQETAGTALFHEREVWWCILGANVGFEQDGRGELFRRPVVILRKFNLDTCLVVPLSAKLKKGIYYFDIGNVAGRAAVINLSQLRLIDRKRLEEKIMILNRTIFVSLQKAVIEACFPGVLENNSPPP
jgi:mRNA interferase MazF